jgi:glycerol-3-phosphate dehydrogenase (NAD(P)+)
MKITILGDGAWGTACAHLLATHGYQVTLWCHNEEAATAISTLHHNPTYLPNYILPSTISATTDLSTALKEASFIFEAIPIKFLRTVLQRCRPFVTENQPWVILSKGIESETLLLPSEIMSDTLGFAIPYVVLSGPSFARDLVQKQPTGVMIASLQNALAQQIKALVSNEYFTTEITDDVIGVQLCGALKNSIALLVGILDGAGYSDNTKALGATRALQELAYCIEHYGGSPKTLMGLAGIGDTLLTAFGKQSRNVLVGKQLGQGASLQTILSSIPQVPESINTIQALYQLQKTTFSLPIMTALYKVIFEQQPINVLITTLMV